MAPHCLQSKADFSALHVNSPTNLFLSSTASLLYAMLQTEHSITYFLVTDLLSSLYIYCLHPEFQASKCYVAFNAQLRCHLPCKISMDLCSSHSTSGPYCPYSWKHFIRILNSHRYPLLTFTTLCFRSLMQFELAKHFLFWVSIMYLAEWCKQMFGGKMMNSVLEALALRKPLRYRDGNIYKSDYTELDARRKLEWKQKFRTRMHMALET